MDCWIPNHVRWLVGIRNFAVLDDADIQWIPRVKHRSWDPFGASTQFRAKTMVDIVRRACLSGGCLTMQGGVNGVSEDTGINRLDTEIERVPNRYRS